MSTKSDLERIAFVEFNKPYNELNSKQRDITNRLGSRMSRRGFYELSREELHEIVQNR